MRYISPFAFLTLTNRNGEERHRFYNNVLDLGDGNEIDASENSIDSDLTLAEQFDTDLDGNEVTRLEMCGMGTLTGVSKTSADVGRLFGIKRGFFYEAPVIEGNDLTAGDNFVAGAYYEVLVGEVTYDGVTYKASDSDRGSRFLVATGTLNVTSPSTGAKVALALPPVLDNYVAQYRDEEFKIKHLRTGNESVDYYLWNTGAEPMSSMDPDDDNFFGHTV